MAVRRQLGVELRRLRGPRRGADVAVDLGWSESKLSRIETARTGISRTDLDSLLATLDVGAAERARIEELSQRVYNSFWWTQYTSAVPEQYQEYVAMEAEAARMLEWEAQVVPGLLQTDEYARVVIESVAEPHSPDILQRRVALRMARQTVLTRRPPPSLCVVMDEGVLRREVGGRAVMQRQVQRLFDATGRSGVELQVLPFDAGVHSALAGAFTIFGFLDDARADLVHIESLTGGLVRSKDAEVQVYHQAFEDLRHRALTVEATRDLLTEISTKLNRPF